MDTLLVMPKDKEEFRFLSEMFAKMDIKSKVLSLENQEDLEFGSLIAVGDNEDYIDETEIMNLLSKVG